MKTKTRSLAPILLLVLLALTVNAQSSTCRLCFQPSNPTLDPIWTIPFIQEDVSVTSDGALSLEMTGAGNIVVNTNQLSIPVSPGDTISVEVRFLNGAVCDLNSPLFLFRNTITGGTNVNYLINNEESTMQCNSPGVDGWTQMSVTVPPGDTGAITFVSMAYFVSAIPGTIQIRNLVIGTTPVPFADDTPVCSDYTPGQLYEVPQATSSSEVTLVVDPATSNPKCGCIIKAYPQENYEGSVTEVRVTKCAFTKDFPLEFLSTKTICAIMT